MERQNSQLGALIYYLDIDKNQWKEEVAKALPLIPNATIEPRPHITVLYGLHHDELDIDQFSAIVNDFLSNNPLTIKLTDYGVFKGTRDIIYLSVTSPVLTNLNQHLRNNFAHTSDHNDYIPHLTLGFSDHHVNLQSLEHVKFDQPIKGSFYYLTPSKEKVLVL